MKREGQKRDVFERYIGEIAARARLTWARTRGAVRRAAGKQAKRRTEIADAVLDEDGQFVGTTGGGWRSGDDVIILEPDDGDRGAGIGARRRSPD